MTIKNNLTPLLFTAYVASALLPQTSIAADGFHAEGGATYEPEKSKRIEVYALSQNYWDTQYGDTLSEIVAQLLPNNPSKQSALKLEIVSLNPHAFIEANPTRLLADKRLWLPGYMKQADSKIDPTKATVESYSWGNIKRPKK